MARKSDVKRGLQWYKREPLAFIDGVQGIGPDTIGAYAVVLDLIYARGGSTPRDDHHLAGILGCSTRKARALTDRLLELGKLALRDGLLVNFRAESELKRARNVSETRANAGRMGGEKSGEARKNKGLGEANVSDIEKEKELEKELDSESWTETVEKTDSFAGGDAFAPGGADADEGGFPDGGGTVVDLFRRKDPKEIIFSCGPVRLSRGKIEEWQEEIYPDIRVRGELSRLEGAITKMAAEGKPVVEIMQTVKATLANRNADALAGKRAAEKAARDPETNERTDVVWQDWKEGNRPPPPPRAGIRHEYISSVDHWYPRQINEKVWQCP